MVKNNKRNNRKKSKKSSKAAKNAKSTTKSRVDRATIAEHNSENTTAITSTSTDFTACYWQINVLELAQLETEAKTIAVQRQARTKAAAAAAREAGRRQIVRARRQAAVEATAETAQQKTAHATKSEQLPKSLQQLHGSKHRPSMMPPQDTRN